MMSMGPAKTACLKALESQSPIKAAYQVAGALAHGGLSQTEQGMVVHQWAVHMLGFINAPNKPIPTTRRWY